MQSECYPRPKGDNGLGVHADANVGNPKWQEDLALIERMGLKWVKVMTYHNSAKPFVEALLDRGIFPVVRMWRDKPNPGVLGAEDREAVRMFAAMGVKYFETTNEPNLACEWHGGMPHTIEECARIAAENWVQDANFILDLGAVPIYAAMAPTTTHNHSTAYPTFDMLGLGFQHIGPGPFEDGAVIGVHNYAFNHPFDAYSDADPCWWPSWRRIGDLAEAIFGFRVGVICTEGGFAQGQADGTYPYMGAYEMAWNYANAFKAMEHEDPYLLAVMPWLLRDTTGRHDKKAVWANVPEIVDRVAAVPRFERRLVCDEIGRTWDSPNHSSRNGAKPRWIVLHDTEGSLAATYQWFMKPDSVSAHVVVDKDGTAYRVVADDRVAWHCGWSLLPGYNYCDGKGAPPTPNANLVTLGVEIVADAYPTPAVYSDAQIEAVRQVVSNWMARYNIPLEHVVCHKDIDAYNRRSDPRNWDHGRLVSHNSLADEALNRIKEIIAGYGL